MLARFSKYDFWNLWKIWDRYRKNPDPKILFFSSRKFILKNQIREFAKISWFFRKFWILLRVSLQTLTRQTSVKFKIDGFLKTFTYFQNVVRTFLRDEMIFFSQVFSNDLDYASSVLGNHPGEFWRLPQRSLKIFWCADKNFFFFCII